MQSSARLIAILVLQSLLATLAFAGDTPKPAVNPQETAAIDDAANPAADAQATQTPPPKHADSSPSMRGPDTPGGEIFAGYSYVRMRTSTGVGLLTVDNNYDFIPGGEASLTGNIKNWFGLKADFGGYGLHDVGGVQGRLWTFLFGPQFSFRHRRFTPFVHTLVGGARVSSSLVIGLVPDQAFFNHNFHQNSFAADAGFGLDVNASRHVAIRLAQVDYLYTRFLDNNNNRQNNFRVSGGLVFRFAYPAAPPPVNRSPTAACAANPDTLQMGSTQVVTIRATASDPDGDPLTYSWTASGGSVDGTGPEVRWNPGSSTPGDYTVTAHVDDGRGGTANCSATIHLQPRPNRPPTMSCSAAATTVPVGQRTQITATASDPDNDPLTYTWSASGGHVVGTGPQVQFDTTGVAAGHYTISGQVNDGRGGTADCKVEVDVQVPVEQRQLETKLSLHSIFFPTAQPTAKNPTGGLLPSQQRTLLTLASDFKRYLTFRPDAKLILHGHTDPRGSAAFNQALSERRVERTKSFLVEQGVAADHIDTEALGIEQSLSAAEITQLADQEQSLTPDQKARIKKNAKVVALAQNRRVDVTLSTTGQTSVRQYPFNAEDVLNLINPRGVAPAKPPVRKGAPKGGTKKGATKGATKKTAPKK